MKKETVRILGIGGSLRRGSFNMLLLEAASDNCPEGIELEIADISQFPLFNQDQENDPPETVVKLKNQIKEADAVLFATPEYNYSIPGVLKNAIDWASRPYGDNSFDDKPAAVMSASIGMLGGARAQYQLRQIFVFLNMHPLNQPEVMVPFVPEKVDNNRITDRETVEKVRELLVSLREWTIRLWDENLEDKKQEIMEDRSGI